MKTKNSAEVERAFVPLRTSVVEDRHRSDLAAIEKTLFAHAKGAVQDWGDHTPELAPRAVNPTELRQTAASMSSLLKLEELQTLDLKIHLGTQFIAAPYDTGWSVGAALGGKFDGDLFVFGSDGFSASGFGFYVTSPESALISVLPNGNFSGSWAALQALPRLRSQLGTGVVVYDGTSIVVSRQPVVWNVVSATAFSGQQFHSSFADTASPPVPNTFGSVPLAPQLFQVQAGHQYLVWFYIWHIGSGFKDAAMIAMGTAKVPLVTVQAGPIPVIH